MHSNNIAKFCLLPKIVSNVLAEMLEIEREKCITKLTDQLIGVRMAIKVFEIIC